MKRTNKEKKKFRLFAIIGGVLLLIGVLYFAYTQFFKGKTKDETEGEFHYSTHVLHPQDPISVKGKSQLQSDDSYFVKSEDGVVETVHVNDGQEVEKGAALYTTRMTSQEAVKAVSDIEREQTKLYNRLERTQAAYNTAQANYANAQNQVTQPGSEGAATTPPPADPQSLKQEIAQINEEIADAEYRLTQAKNGLYQTVTAKNPGKVYLNDAGRSDGTKPFVRVVSVGTFIKGSVNEYEFFAIKDGLSVDLHVPAEDRDLKGKIAHFDSLPEAGAPAAQSSDPSKMPEAPVGMGGESSGEFDFVVYPDSFIQPGFTVEMMIPLTGMIVPEAAIVEEGDKKFVFVLEDGKAKKVELHAEHQGKKLVTTQEDLPEGTILILEAYELKDGQEVKTDQEMMGEDMDGEFLDGEKGEGQSEEIEG